MIYYKYGYSISYDSYVVAKQSYDGMESSIVMYCQSERHAKEMAEFIVKNSACNAEAQHIVGKKID